MNNILYVSENTVKESHVDDFTAGLEKNSIFFSLVDYSDQYNSLGKLGFERYIKNIICTKNINIIIFGFGASCIIDIFFLQSISNEFNIKIIGIFSDSEHLFEDIDRYYAQNVDLAWLLNSSLCGFYDTYGIPNYYGLGFDIDRYKKMKLEKDIDVSFTGNIKTGEREKFVNYLTKMGVNVMLAGFGTKLGQINTKEKNNIVYRTKINVNFTSIENKSKNIYGRVNGPKGRPIEIALLGGFVLSEYSPALEDMFEIGKEIDVFYDENDLVEKIDYYLNHDLERERMASAAHQKAVNNYNINNICKALISYLDDIKYVNKSYYLDRNFSEMYTSSRFYHFAIFLTRGKFRFAFYELLSIRQYKGFRGRNIFYDIPRGVYHTIRKALN